jgi:hypothetical protein
MSQYARSASVFAAPKWIDLGDFVAHALVYVNLLAPRLISQMRTTAQSDVTFQQRIESLRGLLDAAAQHPDKPQYGEAAMRALDALRDFLARSVELSDLVEPLADYRTALAADGWQQLCVSRQIRNYSFWKYIFQLDLPSDHELAAAGTATRQLHDQNVAARHAAVDYAGCLTALNGRQAKLLELRAATAVLAPRYAAMRDSLAEVSQEWRNLQGDVARCAMGLQDS